MAGYKGTETLFRVVVCIWCFTCYVTALQRVPLTGTDWYLSGRNYTAVKATVPGNVYTDLYKGGILENPYYRSNDVAYRWVAYSNWTYTKMFQLDNAFLQNNKHTHLVCEGLDTVANVTINGQFVASVDNMFRRYHWDIRKWLQAGDNLIRIYFYSPTQYVHKQAASYPYPVPDADRDPCENGESYRNFIRKEQSSFSWDWGPAFPTMGIWKDVYVLGFSTATIDSVTINTVYDKQEKSWTISGSVFFLSTADQRIAGTLSLTLDMFPTLTVSYPVRIEVGSDQNYHYSYKLPNMYSQMVEPWFPNGFGTPRLYPLNITFQSDGSADVDSKNIKVGFRTIDLVQEPIKNSHGLTFYFKVNDIPIFMKGSNWIPADSFQERISSDYLKKLLMSAAEANMNMLRVWGGGVYESEEFYQLCDEYGILIWQDFMFASNLYPTNPAFLQNVEAEVRDQIRRLAYHPSIALWSANNENSEVLNSEKDPTGIYHRDYVKLYIETIRKVVLQEDVSRPFVSSSPSNGKFTSKEGWTPKNPNDFYYGDSHNYDYEHDMWDWRNIEVSRFGSEYGLQSWCSLETLSKVALPSDLVNGSDFTKHRQHHTNGNKQMAAEVAMHFRLPNNSNPSTAFQHFIYLTQINQAMGIKNIAEVYRRSQSDVDSKGYGRTMGSLYWQLNDIWQAPTWASIEYGGTWKMLHYYAKLFYNRILISPYIDGNTLNVAYVEDARHEKAFKQHHRRHEKHVNADKLERIVENTIWKFDAPVREEFNKSHLLTIKCYSWHSLEPVHSWEMRFTKPSKAAQVIFHKDLSAMLKEAKCQSPQHCFLYFTLDEDRTPYNAVRNTLYIDTKLYQAIGMQPAKLKIQNIKQITVNEYQFELVTDAVAPFVWLEAKNTSGYFSDNGFTAVQPITMMTFHAWEKTNAASLARALTATSLMDVYRSP